MTFTGLLISNLCFLFLALKRTTTCNILIIPLFLPCPKIPTGTIEVKRTTVPFMYNLDDNIEGLDVVDFPGVDDRDESISDLADLLLTLAQIVIFVVDYR